MTNDNGSLNGRRRVVITGLGALTPLGNDVRSSWDALIRGESGAGPITHFDASEYPVRIAAEVKGFDPETVAPAKEVRRMDRNVLLAVAAAKEAWANSGIEEFEKRRVGILVGSAIGGITSIIEYHDMQGGNSPRSGQMQKIVKETAREAEKTPEIMQVVQQQHPTIADAMAAVNPNLRKKEPTENSSTNVFNGAIA